MSVRKLNIEDNKNDYYIKEFSSESDKTNINIYLQILSNKNIFYVTNLNHSNHIEIKPSSLGNIFLKGQLEANEHILFSFYRDLIPSNHNIVNINNKENAMNNNKKNNYKNKLRGAKKKQKIENENEDSALVISYPDNMNQKSENEYNNIYLNNDNDKNYNINTDPELDLLNDKSKRRKPKNKNEKYLLLLFNNKIKITHEFLLCFYLLLLLCGLIYAVYFLETIITEEKNISSLYVTFSLPMSVILIITGLYGFYRINQKVFDDKICICLTYLSFISPFLSFIFARISSEEDIRKNIIMSVLVNIITALFSGICIYILRQLQGKSQKELLFEKINIA